MLEGKDDDGLYRTFLVPAGNGGRTVSTLSWFATSITSGKTWFKDVRLAVQGETIEISTHRARDADNLAQLVSTSKLLTITAIHGIR